MTHQEIIDRIESVGAEHSKAYAAEQARIAAELKSLMELCGGLGHTFAKDRNGFFGHSVRICVFCRKPEPTPATEKA